MPNSRYTYGVHRCCVALSWFSRKNRVVSQQVVADLLAEVEVKAGSPEAGLTLPSLSTPHSETKSSGAPTPSSSPLLASILGGSSSEVAVTAESAMTCMPVRRAVQAIAGAIGQLPVHVIERTDSGKTRDPDHPVSDILDLAANDWTPSGEFREALTRDALLHDQGGIALIVRVNDMPAELHRLDPRAIKIDQDEFTGAPIYRYTTKNQGIISYDYRDVLHIRAHPFDGRCGESPATLARKAIGFALTLQQHGYDLFANGARPSSVLETDKTLGDRQDPSKGAAILQTLANSFMDAFRNKSGGALVLEQGMKYRPISFSSVDSQYLELRTFVVQDIARAFDVPPTKLFDLSHGTMNNVEEAGNAFLSEGLLRWIKIWEGECQLKLFDLAERKSHFIEFQTADLARADLLKRYQAYSAARTAGILSPNEIRSLENLPRRTDPEGDMYLNPNTTPGAHPMIDVTPNRDALPKPDDKRNA